jgi:hypothetical protein
MSDSDQPNPEPEPDPGPENGSTRPGDPISDFLAMLGSLSSLSTLATPIAQAIRQQVNTDQIHEWKSIATDLFATFSHLQDSVEQLRLSIDTLNDHLVEIRQSLAGQEDSPPG